MIPWGFSINSADTSMLVIPNKRYSLYTDPLTNLLVIKKCVWWSSCVTSAVIFRVKSGFITLPYQTERQ